MTSLNQTALAAAKEVRGIASTEGIVRAYLDALPAAPLPEEVERVCRLLRALATDLECDDEVDAAKTCDEAAALLRSIAGERDEAKRLGEEWCTKGQMMADAAGSWMARAEAAEASLAEVRKALEDFAKHINWELDWGNSDPTDESSECVWRVHACNGGRNDREWELLGIGDTPLAAIKSALARLDTPEKK